MAAHHPTGAAQLLAIVNADGIDQLTIQAVHAQAITAMLPARAVQVAALPEVQPDMGAALGASKKDQVARAQLAVATRGDRHGLAEPLLLVGVPRNPHTSGGIGGLGEARAVEIWAKAATQR